MESVGILSLLPPALAIGLAIWTRQVVFSLFCGVWVGALILNHWNPILATVASFKEYLFPQLGDAWNASCIIYVIILGGFTGILEKGGSAIAFVRSLGSIVTNRIRAQVAAWLGGIAIWFSDTPNTLIIGPVFRPLTDEHRVSREKLAYIVDSTSAPLPVLFPITGWGAFILSLIKKEFEALGTTELPLVAYVKSVPFVLYSFAAVLLVFLVAVLKFDWGPMRLAERRALVEGKLIRDGAKPLREPIEVTLPPGSRPSPLSMPITMVVLLLAILVMFAWTGGYPKVSFWAAFGNADSMTSLCVAFFVATVVAALFAWRDRTLTFSGILEAWAEGVNRVVPGAVILVLAWGIGAVCRAVGTGKYIVGITEGVLTPWLAYLLIFVAACFASFGTGTSWGTFALVMPIAIPLAVAMKIPVYPAIGAVLAGGVFGDHCSPISDTTILSSIGSSCDHIDHVKTQLPYAIFAAGCCAVGFIIAGLTFSPVLAPLVTVAVLVTACLLLKNRYGAITAERAQ